MFSVFRDLNQFAGKWKILDYFAIFCARLLPYLMIIFLLLFYLWQNNLKIFFYCLLSALFSRYVLNEIIYFFYKSQRPARSTGARILIPIPKNPSFPSGHASFFFGLTFALFFYNLALAAVFIACSLIVGVSRVFCGAHWFRDILGGAVAGAVSAILINTIFSL